MCLCVQFFKRIFPDRLLSQSQIQLAINAVLQPREILRMKIRLADVTELFEAENGSVRFMQRVLEVGDACAERKRDAVFGDSHCSSGVICHRMCSTSQDFPKNLGPKLLGPPMERSYGIKARTKTEQNQYKDRAKPVQRPYKDQSAGGKLLRCTQDPGAMSEPCGTMRWLLHAGAKTWQRHRTVREA